MKNLESCSITFNTSNKGQVKINLTTDEFISMLKGMPIKCLAEFLQTSITGITLNINANKDTTLYELLKEYLAENDSVIEVVEVLKRIG